MGPYKFQGGGEEINELIGRGMFIRHLITLPVVKSKQKAKIKCEFFHQCLLESFPSFLLKGSRNYTIIKTTSVLEWIAIQKVLCCSNN